MKIIECRKVANGGILLTLRYMEPDYARTKREITTGHERNIIVREYHAPCGRLALGSFGGQLCLCDWRGGSNRDRVANRLRRDLSAEFVSGCTPVIEMASAMLDEYFAGVRHEFDVPLLMVGTQFQRRVWDALQTVDYGQTISYAGLARRIGMPGSVRAVANATGGNALSIFAPCHRVIGSDKSLTGYAGGLEAKKYLLRLEGII